MLNQKFLFNEKLVRQKTNIDNDIFILAENYPPLNWVRKEVCAHFQLFIGSECLKFDIVNNSYN
jgi:hypothetical protein